MHSQWVALLFAVCAIDFCSAKHSKSKNPHHDITYCFSVEELENSPAKVLHHFVGSKMHWERYTAVNMVPKLEETERRRKRRKRASETTCPRFNALENGQSLNERSISPWTYRIHTDENRYPQKLAYAHCLCHHCISSETGRETSSLNSVPVQQTMLVLRKKTCPHDSALSTFVLEYENIPVACTCSVPRY